MTVRIRGSVAGGPGSATVTSGHRGARGLTRLSAKAPTACLPRSTGPVEQCPTFKSGSTKSRVPLPPSRTASKSTRCSIVERPLGSRVMTRASGRWSYVALLDDPRARGGFVVPFQTTRSLPGAYHRDLRRGVWPPYHLSRHCCCHDERPDCKCQNS